MMKKAITAALVLLLVMCTAAIAQGDCTHTGGWVQFDGEMHSCTNCGEVFEHEMKPKTVASTCQSVGYTMDVCSLCGYEGAQYDIRDADPDAHVWSDWKTKRQATCTQTGLRTHSCTVCGKSEDEETPMASHDMKAVIYDPDCMNDGYTQLVCSVCGKTGEKTDIIPRSAAYHKWSAFSTTKEATCTQDGEQVRACSVCGANHRQTIVHEGHVPATVTVAPGCEDGYTVEKCENCGQELSARRDIVPAVHQWGEWENTVPAGCEMPGEDTRTCVLCGAKDTQEVAPTGHEWQEVVCEPSCIADGYSAVQCAICGALQGEKYDIVLGGDEYHIWDEDGWEREAEPTCTQWGLYWQECKICGHMRKVPVLPKGHEGVETCVEAGFARDGYKVLVCAVCGEEAGQRYEIVPAQMYSMQMQETQVSDLQIEGAQSAILYTVVSDEGETAAVLEVHADAAGKVLLDMTDEWYREHAVVRVCVVHEGITVSLACSEESVLVEIACAQEEEGLLVSVLTTLPVDGFDEENGSYSHGVYSALVGREGDTLFFGRCLSVKTPHGPGTLLVVSAEN